VTSDALAVLHGLVTESGERLSVRCCRQPLYRLVFGHAVAVDATTDRTSQAPENYLRARTRAGFGKTTHAHALSMVVRPW
jgi:hypothetical protein